MTHLDPIISDLALILAVAGVTTLLFKWLKQPVVLGYIVAGFLCSGNFLLQGVSNMGNVDIWAEIGIIFLLFSLGLEFSFKKLMNVGGPALMTALVVIVGMMCSGFMAGRALGWTSTDSIFLGGMLSMSSTTIIIKAFDDLGLRSQKFTSLVFGVLVVEDLFAVVLMVMLSTLFVQRAVEHVVIAEQLFKLIFFLILWFVVGIYLIPTFLKKNTEIPESGNAAGDLAGPLPDYGRAGDLRRIFVCARGVHHGVDPSRDGTGREHREGHRSGQGPVRGGLLRVGRDAGRAGDAGAIHRADRFFDGGRDRRTDILRDARFPRVGTESENRVAVVVLAGADRRVRLYHRVARTVDGGYQFVPLSGRGGRVGRDHIYHAVYHPAQRSCLSPDQPVDSEADESAAGPVQRRVANRQQRAGVDVAAEKSRC